MAKTKFGYAESSNLKATKAGHIFDVIQDGAALENGMLKKLGELDEVLEVREVTDAAAGDKVVLILSALVGDDDSSSTNIQEWYYRKEDGEVARAYELVEEDRFAVADYMIDALSDSVVVGNTVLLDTTTKFYKEAASTSDADNAKTNGFMARIEGVENKGALNIVRLRVIKNATVVPAA